MSNCCNTRIIQVQANSTDVFVTNATMSGRDLVITRNGAPDITVPDMFGVYPNLWTAAEVTNVTQIIDFAQLTGPQITALMQVLDFTQLNATQCQDIFQCILDNGTQAQFDALCAAFGPILNVSTGPDGVVANATSTADVNCGENIHFFSSDGSIDFTVTQGSGLVDITYAASGQVHAFGTENADYDLLAFPPAQPVNAPTSPNAGDTYTERYSNGTADFTHNGTDWQLTIFTSNDDRKFTHRDETGQDYVQGSLAGPQNPPANPDQADVHMELYDNAMVFFNYQASGPGAGWDGNNITYVPLNQPIILAREVCFVPTDTTFGSETIYEHYENVEGSPATIIGYTLAEEYDSADLIDISTYQGGGAISANECPCYRTSLENLVDALPVLGSTVNGGNATSTLGRIINQDTAIEWNPNGIGDIVTQTVYFKSERGTQIPAEISVTQLNFAADANPIMILPDNTSPAAGQISFANQARDVDVEIRILPDCFGNVYNGRFALNAGSIGATESLFFYPENQVVEFAQGTGGQNISGSLPYDGAWNNNNNNAQSGFGFDATNTLRFRKNNSASAGASIFITLRDVGEAISYTKCEILDITKTVVDTKISDIQTQIDGLPVDTNSFGLVQTATAPVVTTNGASIAIGQEYIIFPNATTWGEDDWQRIVTTSGSTTVVGSGPDKRHYVASLGGNHIYEIDTASSASLEFMVEEIRFSATGGAMSTINVVGGQPFTTPEGSVTSYVVENGESVTFQQIGGSGWHMVNRVKGQSASGTVNISTEIGNIITTGDDGNLYGLPFIETVCYELVNAQNQSVGSAAGGGRPALADTYTATYTGSGNVFTAFSLGVDGNATDLVWEVEVNGQKVNTNAVSFSAPFTLPTTEVWTLIEPLEISSGDVITITQFSGTETARKVLNLQGNNSQFGGTSTIFANSVQTQKANMFSDGETDLILEHGNATPTVFDPTGWTLVDCDMSLAETLISTEEANTLKIGDDGFLYAMPLVSETCYREIVDTPEAGSLFTLGEIDTTPVYANGFPLSGTNNWSGRQVDFDLSQLPFGARIKTIRMHDNRIGNNTAQPSLSYNGSTTTGPNPAAHPNGISPAPVEHTFATSVLLVNGTPLIENAVIQNTLDPTDDTTVPNFISSITPGQMTNADAGSPFSVTGFNASFDFELSEVNTYIVREYSDGETSKLIATDQNGVTTEVATIDPTWTVCENLDAAGITSADIQAVQLLNTNHVCFEELTAGPLVDNDAFLDEINSAQLSGLSSGAHQRYTAQGEKEILDNLQVNGFNGTVEISWTTSTGISGNGTATFGTNPQTIALGGIELLQGETIDFTLDSISAGQMQLSAEATATAQGWTALQDYSAFATTSVWAVVLDGSISADRGEFARTVDLSNGDITYRDLEGAVVDTSAWTEKDCNPVIPTQATKYVQDIVVADWTGPVAGEYTISIPFATHAITNPVIQIMEDDGAGNLSVVTAQSATINAANDVTITVTDVPDQRFDGRIILV